MTGAAAARTYGFIGLGNMGGPMSANLARWAAQAGHGLVVYDKAGTVERGPAGAEIGASAAQVGERCDAVFLSLPDGAASLDVIGEIAAGEGAADTTVIDLSTIGIEAARAAFETCREAGAIYIDAPVSGGAPGARAGTVAVMWAGSEELLERHRSALEAMAGNVFHVGDLAGQGQALKLLNNFLSATATAATSEAMLFGLSQGLDLETMLAVVRVSTGNNTAVSDKFPKRIVTETYDSGFATALMAKDMALYRDSVRAEGTPRRVGDAVVGLWLEADAAMPGSDQTRLFEFLKGGGEN